jgi:hypothetical protein
MAAFAGQPVGTTVHLIIDVNAYFEKTGRNSSATSSKGN